MTIKDIAKEAGYSVGTVSRVLNSADGVSEKARKRIMEIVNKYHFQLNSNAKHLKKQTKEGIAILIKGTQNMFLAGIVEQMQDMIRRKDYACMVYYLDEDDNEVEQAITICAERRPMGILILGANPAYYETQRFSLITVPCVLVSTPGEQYGLDNLSSVSTDNESAAQFAIEHLLSLGHKRIGILGGRIATSQTVFSRYQGCKNAFEQHDMEFNPDEQYESAHFTISDGYYAMQRLMRKMPDVTAVFAMADVMAIGAIRAIQDKGLKVPEDISVIGFDGLELGNYMVPRLTTIRQHSERIASRGVEIMLKNIDGDYVNVHEIEPFYLVPGESVCKR